MHTCLRIVENQWYIFLIFIKRDIDKLPVEGRPLSQTRDLEEMYKERLPLYQAAADSVMENI